MDSHSDLGDDELHTISSSSAHIIDVIQVVPDECPDENEKRSAIVRRPFYRKLLSDLSGDEKLDDRSSGSSGSQSLSQVTLSTVHSGGKLLIPLSQALQLSADSASGLQALTMGGGSGNTVLQYAQAADGSFFLTPSSVDGVSAYKLQSSSNQNTMVSGGSGGAPEEGSRKREMRLMKNREAARECRRKKKDYIKCLENRVAVLENQNKALIEELKQLKELYCQNDSQPQ